MIYLKNKLQFGSLPYLLQFVLSFVSRQFIFPHFIFITTFLRNVMRKLKFLDRAIMGTVLLYNNQGTGLLYDY